MIVALLFLRDDTARLANPATIARGDGIGSRAVAFLIALIALLIAGTLTLD